MTYSNALELAKQGDVKAIAFLINHQLQTKGITAKIAIKNNCLQVMLESSEVPNQEALVTLIRKEITALKVASIERVKVYGRQIGDEFPAWTNEFEVVLQASLTKPLERINQNNEFYEIEGSNGQIRLTHTRVIISRKGVSALSTHGVIGDKEIPISRITAIEFKRCDSLKGYLQFSIEGGLESKGGILEVVQDENTVLFTDLQEPQFEEVKRYIDSIIDGKPIDFDALKFTELEEIYITKSEEENQIREELAAANKASNEASNKAAAKFLFKVFLVGAIFSLIVMLLSPDYSVSKALSGLTLIASGTSLLFTLPNLTRKEMSTEINKLSSYLKFNKK